MQDTHTERTRAWLDQHVLSAEREVGSRHRAFYRDATRLGKMPVGHVVYLARTYSILTALAELEFETCLDVGAGTGRLGHLIEVLLRAQCAGIDLSREFARVARSDFGFPVYPGNAAALPFADAQFDLVICSEVIEHVEHPFAVLSELHRVARRAVVVTTQEACRNRWHRRLQMAGAERDDPHGERNYTLTEDFRRAFGGDLHAQALLHLPERIRSLLGDSVESLERCIRELTSDCALGPGSFGVFVVARKTGGGSRPAERPTHERILQAVLDLDRRIDARAAAGAGALGLDPFPAGRSLPPPVCPACRGGLSGAQTGARCAGCGAEYPVVGGVLELFADRQVIYANERRWEARPELQPMVHALRQRPLPSRTARTLLRFAVKLGDFLVLPLPWSEKLKLAWLFLRR